MSYSFQITFDCHDLDAMTRFWACALGYSEQPPPDGHASWAGYARELGIPKEQWHGALVDPEEVGPRLFFQPVPEGKMAKNRVHLDINVTADGTTPAAGRELAVSHMWRCQEAGATVLTVADGDEDGEWWVVMADPEGNEFCIQ